MSKRLREMRESESERHREIERGGREGGRARERVKGREGDLSSGACTADMSWSLEGLCPSPSLPYFSGTFSLLLSR